MKKPIIKIIVLLFIFVCNPLFSQSYEYHQGYIFAQKYIKRISLEKAEEIAGSPDVFNQFFTWDWAAEGTYEDITVSGIERVGDRLVITFEKESSLSLRDFSMTEGDGDLQLFRYLKSVAGYHIIGVIFGHDQPAFLLINTTGTELYFVNTY